MPEDYVILADSGSDLTPEAAAHFGITLIPLSYTLNGGEALRCDKTDYKKFYAEMRGGAKITTCGATFPGMCSVFDRYGAFGRDVLYITFSSALSTSVGSSVLAIEEVKKKYPHRKFLMVDSVSASLGYGLLACLAAKQRDEGKTIEEVCSFVEECRFRVNHLFTVDDLGYLRRGGYISAADAVVGTLLSNKSVMKVDNEGRLVYYKTVRGRQAALDTLCEAMAKTAVEPEKQIVFISHADAESDAKYVEKQVRERLGVEKTHIGYIGPFIGAHSGPGAVALFYLGKER